MDLGPIREKIDQLDSQLVQLLNERLALALSLSTAAPGGLRWARVIERDPQNWHRALMIDAGAEDGEGDFRVHGVRRARG